MLKRTFFFLREQQQQQYGRSPGFSIVNVSKDDLTKGFRARFVYSANKNSVFMQYSTQTALPDATTSSDNGGNNSKRPNLFSGNLQVAIPTNAVVRFLTTLEGAAEPVDFASRQATGKFEPVDPAQYTFRLSGKSTTAATENTPTEFDINVDAGHAVMMHRFFRHALADSMGFPAPEVDAPGNNNNRRGNANRRNNNN